MTVTLYALLWARAGHEAGLAAYEDEVLGFVPDHGGRVLQRGRTHGRGDDPLEIHLLEFPSQAALDAYLQDERRVALAADRDRAIERTEIYYVDPV